jgi:hypothetical protein
MAEPAGYVLRIKSNQWVDHVFNMAIYYTNLRRKWETGQTVIFTHKMESGDAVVGYGVIGNVCPHDELSEEERVKSEEWRMALVFRYVLKLEKPLPIQETFLKQPKFRGRYMHGLALSKEQLDAILTQTEPHSA